MSQSQWHCGLCSTQFTRAEHLRRHLRSHENKRPYECSLCQRSFTRRDAKTRHEKTCKVQPSEQDGSLGDAAQVSTSPTQIPTACFDKLFHGVGEEFLMNVPSPPDFAALDWLYGTQINPDSIITAERLEFLARFTSENGMGTFLDQETLDERQKIVLEHENTSGHIAACVGSNVSGSFLSQTVEPSMLHMGSEEVDPLTTRTFEILHHFHSLTARKTDKSVVRLDWTEEVESLCRLFFSPSNITRFLGYFWSLWYPNCPFIHRASFDPQSAPPALLCVMLVIGACLSPHPDDASTARMWLDCVEELAFSDSSFSEECTSAPSHAILDQYLERKKKRLECLQMAYLVCSLQKREGSTEARNRVRRYRHATMVMLARDIGLATASHRELSLDGPSETWWRQFAIEEGLIRTITYVFLFDAAFTIFRNSPPRMVVSELKMETACPEASFQAGSAEECFAALEGWKQTIFWRRHSSIVSVVKGLCQKELTAESADEYSKMGTLNLFTAVQCIHSLTFHLQNSIIFESTLLPVKTGLENWRRIWNRRIPEDQNVPNHPDTLWKKFGHASYSAELWHLARIIVQKIRDDNADVGEDENSAPVLERPRKRYDNTDMTDVNGLIMEYRRLSLGGGI